MFLRQYHMLVCRDCNVGLDKTFYAHCLNRHRQRPTSHQVEHIASTYLQQQSAYFRPSNLLLPPLPFRMVIEGFRCSVCPYFAKSKKVLEKHIRLQQSLETPNIVHEAAAICSCLVQQASDFKHHPYVGVLAPQDVQERINGVQPEVQDEVQDAAQVNHLFLALNPLERILVAEEEAFGDMAMPMEEGDQLAFFYATSSWHVLQDMEGIPIAELIRVGHTQDEANEMRLIKNHFTAGMNAATNEDIVVRFKISYAGRYFGRLLRDQTVEEYSDVLARFMLFMRKIHLGSEELRNRLLPLPVQESMQNWIEAQREADLWNVIVALLEIHPLSAQCNMNPLVLFVRCKAVHDPTCLMDGEKIGRLLVKVSQ